MNTRFVVFFSTISLTTHFVTFDFPGNQAFRDIRFYFRFVCTLSLFCLVLLLLCWSLFFRSVLSRAVVRLSSCLVVVLVPAASLVSFRLCTRYGCAPSMINLKMIQSIMLAWPRHLTFA